jgi:hypothetical protein
VSHYQEQPTTQIACHFYIVGQKSNVLFILRAQFGDQISCIAVSPTMSFSSDNDSSGNERPRLASRLCYRCQSIEFDESNFGGCKKQSCNQSYLRLESQANPRVHSTGIGGHTALNIGYQFEDEYPGFPDLRDRAGRCDFCRFLREGLRSKEVRLAIFDEYEGRDFETASFCVKVMLLYSWEPERRNQRDQRYENDYLYDHQQVGLDALYVYIGCVNPERDSVTDNPVLPDGIICVLRYSVTSTESGKNISDLMPSMNAC